MEIKDIFDIGADIDLRAHCCARCPWLTAAMNRLTQPPSPRKTHPQALHRKRLECKMRTLLNFSHRGFRNRLNWNAAATWQKGATVICIKVKTIWHYLAADLEWFETFQNFPESFHTAVISRPIVEIVENGHDPSVDRAGQLAIVADDSLQTRIVGKSEHLPYLSSVFP